MLERMLRTFVPNYTQTGDPAVRERYGVLAGAVGILLNLLLFAGKLLAEVDRRSGASQRVRHGRRLQ